VSVDALDYGFKKIQAQEGLRNDYSEEMSDTVTVKIEPLFNVAGDTVIRL